MSTETAQHSMIFVPRKEIYGVGRISGLSNYGPSTFEGQIARDITDFDMRLTDTIAGEITLADQNALFQRYLEHKFNGVVLPDDVRDVCYRLFRMHGGNKTSTVVDYDRKDHVMKKTKDTDRRVTVIVKASKFWRDADGTVKYKPAEDSEVLDAVLPAPGYTEWTRDGDRDPRTGFAFSTNLDRSRAVKTWTDNGFPEDFAKEIVSYQFTRNEGEGAAGVDRRHFGGDGGRFNVGADWCPENGNPYWGSFLASRSPSGARHAAEN